MHFLIRAAFDFSRPLLFAAAALVFDLAVTVVVAVGFCAFVFCWAKAIEVILNSIETVRIKEIIFFIFVYPRFVFILQYQNNISVYKFSGKLVKKQ
jgi:hypothetical protein